MTCWRVDSKTRSSGSRNIGRAIVRELERERSRIARELHAGAGQPLAGIKLDLEMLDGCAAIFASEAGREAFALVHTLADQAAPNKSEPFRTISIHLIGKGLPPETPCAT